MLSRTAAIILPILLLGICASSSIAQESATKSGKPDATSIVNRMKLALEPAVPSVRVMTLKVNGPRGSAVQWRMAQARGESNGSKWMLTVMLLPSSWGKGIALLDEDKPSSAAAEYIYLPAVQRVRRFTPLQAWEPFSGATSRIRTLASRGLAPLQKSRAPKYITARSVTGWKKLSLITRITRKWRPGLPLTRDYQSSATTTTSWQALQVGAL